MAATPVLAKRQGGYDTVITVTNGTTYVTISLPPVFDDKGKELRPATSIHLTEEQADKLVDVITNKSVNVHRGVHDSTDGAL